MRVLARKLSAVYECVRNFAARCETADTGLCERSRSRLLSVCNVLRFVAQHGCFGSSCGRA